MSKADPEDLKLIESVKTGKGLIKLDIDSLKDLARHAKATKDSFDEDVETMTKKQAKFIRKIRVDGGYTWRAVARECHDQSWNNLNGWEPSSNQLMGMALCGKAAKFFGEDMYDDKWN